MSKIVLEHRRNYGHDRYYPGCHTAAMVAECAGCKSFSPRHLEVFKKHGFEIEYVKEVTSGQ